MPRSLRRRLIAVAGLLAGLALEPGVRRAAAVPTRAAPTPKRLAPAFDNGRLDFSVRVGRGTGAESSSYRTMAFFALPGAPLELELESAQSGATFGVSGGIALEKRGGRRFSGIAPSTPGIYPLVVERASDRGAMRLLVVVLVPSAAVQDGKLGGYEIGAYPSPPLKGNPIYVPPAGFVQVTRENENTEIAPHFTLRQFLCKQAGDYPKYLVLTTRLLRELEQVLEEANASGLRADRFAVLSAYRTPTYNAAIHDVEYSRHQWGDAADIYIDNDGDGEMDDLDHDGRSDIADAQLLSTVVENMPSAAGAAGFVGGLGIYAKTPSHGPFLHVDCRGFRARWTG